MSDQASSTTQESDLKAGHAPAVKAGGMRVARHGKPPAHNEVRKPPTEEEQEEYGLPPPEDKHKQQILVSGTVAKGDKDFPAAAVKAYHDKPQPTHEKPHNTTHHVIHQPAGRM